MNTLAADDNLSKTIRKEYRPDFRQSEQNSILQQLQQLTVYRARILPAKAHIGDVSNIS